MAYTTVRVLLAAGLLSTLVVGTAALVRPLTDDGCKTVAGVCQTSGSKCLYPKVCSDNTADGTCQCFAAE